MFAELFGEILRAVSSVPEFDSPAIPRSAISHYVDVRLKMRGSIFSGCTAGKRGNRAWRELLRVRRIMKIWKSVKIKERCAVGE